MSSTKPEPVRSYSRREFLAASATAAAGRGLLPHLASAGRAGRPPNILLVFPDQLRRDWNSFTPGVPVRTPHLARLAAEGARFLSAYCPTPLCAPSRACLAQGRRYGRTGVLSNRDDNPDDVDTFYQRLRDAGYRVASLGKADLRKGAFDWGPDGLHRVRGRVYFREWGFTDGFDSEGKMAVVNGVRKRRKQGHPLDPYAGMLAARQDGSLETYLAWYKEWEARDVENHNYGQTNPCDLASDAYNDNWVGAHSLALLRSGFPRGQPWFLQVNFPGPHDPMDITRDMAEWYRDATFPLPIRNSQLPAPTHQAIRRNYSAMAENIDRWLGRFLQALEERGERERTLVVFSSDHGEMLGDHDCWGKSVPYEASAGVPLVVRGPGVAAGRVHRRVTTTLDLPATFLDLAGIPTPGTMDSHSLGTVLGGSGASGAPITAALANWRLACDGRFKLVQGIDLSRTHGYGGGAGVDGTAAPGGAPTLFDLQADPQELDNVAARHPEVVARLLPLLPPRSPLPA